MLVSHRYQFIYTKTKKTAGTSVESFFERFCMADGEWEQSHTREQYESSSGIIGFRGAKTPPNTRWYNHMSASEIKKLLGDDTWNRYFKFCVIRNPFDKCVSAFEHFGKKFKVNKFNLLHRFATAGMTSEQSRFLSYVSKSAQNVDRDKYVIDGTFCLDDIIRFESLETDIARICEHLSLPYDPQYLPTFKKGHRRKDATVESLYTPAAKKRVAKMFDFELAQFNYEFPAPSSDSVS